MLKLVISVVIAAALLGLSTSGCTSSTSSSEEDNLSLYQKQVQASSSLSTIIGFPDCNGRSQLFHTLACRTAYNPNPSLSDFISEAPPSFLEEVTEEGRNVSYAECISGQGVAFRAARNFCIYCAAETAAYWCILAPDHWCCTDDGFDNVYNLL